jgi:lipid-binding SYLF domain-containing protein
MKNYASLIVACASLIAGCSGPPTTDAQKDALTARVQSAIAEVKRDDPTISKFFDTSAGYAVLPSVGKGGFIVSGAGGDGALFHNGTLSGYCSMGQGSIGLTAGGQAFDEFIFFKDEAAYRQFVTGEWALAAQVSAVMVQAGGAAAADYQGGVAVFINSLQGAMVEASVGGQKFTYHPLDAGK